MYFTHISSPVGSIFLAGEGRRVSKISFTTGHQVRTPEPGWVEGAAGVRPAVTQIEEYFAGDRTEFDLDLVLEGTDFQKRVWQILREIPFGEAWSYGRVAERLGNPGAARAVGMANNRNHLPLVIPCHRVIGSNGSLVGFGGGLETKEWLLRFEGAPGVSDGARAQLPLF